MPTTPKPETIEVQTAKAVGPAATCSARATIELGHTGDYPGYPCGRINDRPLGDEQWRLLLSIFAVPGDGVGYERRRKLFEMLGATKQRAKIFDAEGEYGQKNN